LLNSLVFDDLRGYCPKQTGEVGLTRSVLIRNARQVAKESAMQELKVKTLSRSANSGS
jgi:hypothetical protein